MPLHYSYEDCDVDGVADSVIEAVIFGTMSLGITEITEDNLDEWLDRAKVRAALFGPAVYDRDKPHVCLLTDGKPWSDSSVSGRMPVTSSRLPNGSSSSMMESLVIEMAPAPTRTARERMTWRGPRPLLFLWRER